MIPVVSARDIPSLTTAEMIEVDRAMMQEYRIDLPRMMENAGRSLASLTRSNFLGGSVKERVVLVLAGRGGNGGGALVAARHLCNWGAEVTVMLAQARDAMTPVPEHQLGILVEMGVRIATQDGQCTEFGGFDRADVIIDGLIGYSLKGAPVGPAAALIERANKSGAPIVSLDTPSGVDAGSGDVFEPAIEAAATMTLALPKTGLLDPRAAKNIGELYCADISVPPGLYARFLSKQVSSVFSESEIVRIGMDLDACL